MNYGINALKQTKHGRKILQFSGDDLFTATRHTQVIEVADTENVA
jgi:hypothetical protein